MTGSDAFATIDLAPSAVQPGRGLGGSVRRPDSGGAPIDERLKAAPSAALRRSPTDGARERCLRTVVRWSRRAHRLALRLPLGPSIMELRGRQLVSTAFEHHLGVHTAGYVSLRDLRLDADDRVDYEPSGFLVLRRALRRVEVCKSDVFLDFGSGKGRIVLQAAKYPFRRVVGVEISPELHRIAERNVERSRHRLRCSEVVLVNSPAEEFAVPDDVTVVYFFNPFHGKPFADVVRALIASFDRNPRPLRIIYHNARDEDVLLATGRVETVWTMPAVMANPSRVYRVLPPPRALQP